MSINKLLISSEYSIKATRDHPLILNLLSKQIDHSFVILYLIVYLFSSKFICCLIFNISIELTLSLTSIDTLNYSVFKWIWGNVLEQKRSTVVIRVLLKPRTHSCLAHTSGLFIFEFNKQESMPNCDSLLDQNKSKIIVFLIHFVR